MDVSDLDARAAAVKQQISDRQAERASAEHALTVAQARAEAAEQELREEFGITPEEAPGLIEKLGTDLAAEVTRAEELLERARADGGGPV